MTGEKVFNTGKIKIGCMYQASRPVYHDRDALRLQSALLGHKPQTDWDGIGIVAGVIAFIGILLVPGWVS